MVLFAIVSTRRKNGFVNREFQKEDLMSLAQIIHAILYVHPPHSLLVHFPIALVSAGLFFILLALILKKDILEQIAFCRSRPGGAEYPGDRDRRYTR